MSSFFKYLKHHETYFAKHGQKVTYKKGHYIVLPTEQNNYVYFLVEGYVGVSFTFADGVDRLIGYFIPGMTFAQSGSFFNDDGGGLEYYATSKTTVYRLRKEDFFKTVETNALFNKDYIELILRNQIFLIDRIIYQGEKGIHAKCIRWLLFMIKYYGQKKGAACTLMVPTTQETVANFLHITRESASAALAELKKKGLITVDKKYITITNCNKLQKELH